MTEELKDRLFYESKQVSFSNEYMAENVYDSKLYVVKPDELTYIGTIKQRRVYWLSGIESIILGDGEYD